MTASAIRIRTAFRRAAFRRGVAPAALLWLTLAPAAWGQSPAPETPAAEPPSNAPMRLVPLGPSDPPDARMPDAPAQNGATALAPSGVQVETLGALPVDTGGTLHAGNGGFDGDLWQGTPRALVEGLIPRLPDRMASGALRDLARRLLLSQAAAPAGDGPAGPEGQGRGLAGLRLERLALLGDAASSQALAEALPAALEDGTAAEAWMAVHLLAGDPAPACAKAPDLLRRFPSATFQKYQIVCQILAGQMEAAILGIDLLREMDGQDDVFFRLAEAAVAGQKQPVKGVVSPTSAQLALIRASGRGLPADVTVAAPAELAAVAMSAETPVAARLAAAEKAAALGALPERHLLAVYRSVKSTPQDMQDISAGTSKRTPAEMRAVLVQALANEPAPAVKAELLRQAVALADTSLLSGGYGALLAQEIGVVPPTAAFGFVAPAAARLLLLQGRIDLARPWVEIARVERRGGNADPRSFMALWPLARLNGLARPDEVDLGQWLDAMGTASDAVPDAPARLGAVLALMDAAGEPADPMALVRVLDASAPQTGILPGPALWFRLQDAGAGKRVGEAALLSLLLIGGEGPARAPTLVTAHAVRQLAQAGAPADARRLATEAVAALLPL